MTAGKRYRVVVADDVADMRFLLTRALESNGPFEVVGVAGTGGDAIAEATRHRPDLTLLDLEMPEMDGLEALPHIRAAVPDCTVVVVSGFEPERMAHKARERGAAGYLVKGLSPRRLVDDLVVLLERLEAPQTGSDEAQELARADIQLPGTLASGRQARNFLKERLCGWSLERVLDTAMLLTTELVTNAVIHARSAVDIRVRVTTDRLRIEVADTGPGALMLRRVTTQDVAGRGLMLLDALSSAWGTSADERGKLVWFELPTARSG